MGPAVRNPGESAPRPRLGQLAHPARPLYPPLLFESRPPAFRFFVIAEEFGRCRVPIWNVPLPRGCLASLWLWGSNARRPRCEMACFQSRALFVVSRLTFSPPVFFLHLPEQTRTLGSNTMCVWQEFLAIM